MRDVQEFFTKKEAFKLIQELTELADQMID
jgi:hypothetical protein